MERGLRFMDKKDNDFQRKVDDRFDELWDKMYPNENPYSVSARLYVEELAEHQIIAESKSRRRLQALGTVNQSVSNRYSGIKSGS